LVERHSPDTHHITKNQICSKAKKILNSLNTANYEAYLVGGAVLDLLLDKSPKDFDIATEAHPEEVKKVFPSCRLIGRRFRLAHVHFGRDYLEVATFRAPHDDDKENTSSKTSDDGRIIHDNVYGTLEQDAFRRDFTVNALFYNLQTGEVLDHVNGMDDIKSKQLRLIGDPETLYREDPVRMLRALRFVAKLDFELDKTAAQPIAGLAHLLDEVPAARLFDEVLKLFQKGHALNSFNVLREHHLFSYLFLQAEEALDSDRTGYIDKIIRMGLENTDRRVQQGKSVNPAFLFSFFLWGALRDTVHARNDNLDHIPAVISAAQEVFSAQIEQTSLPKRFSIQVREIWALQPRFDQRRGKRPQRLLSHPRFRAAYDFLLLRNDAGEDLQEQCDWWTEFQELDENKQIQETRANDRNRSRRSRGRGRGPKPQQDESSTPEG